MRAWQLVKTVTMVRRGPRWRGENEQKITSEVDGALPDKSLKGREKSAKESIGRKG